MPNRVTLGASRTSLGTALLPVAADHVIVTPTTVSGGPGDLMQLTAVVYDAQDNVLAGRAVTWSSDAPSVATVSSTGLVTLLSSGAAVITATSEGMTDTAAAVVVIPLSFKLNWAPLVRRSDLAQPPSYVPLSGGTGGPGGVPLFSGCATLGVTRISYPKTADEWGLVAPGFPPMVFDQTPDSNYAARTQLNDQGPFNNTCAWRIRPSDPYAHNCVINNIWRDGDTTQDRQDYTTYKRSLACAIRADTGTDIGKSVRLNIIDQALAPGGAGWYGTTPLLSMDVILTADFKSYQLTLTGAQRNAIATIPILVVTMAPPLDTTPIVNYVVAGYPSINWQAEEGASDNWFRPFPFHEELGVESTYQVRNGWGVDCDNPLMYNGGTSASTAVAAPDSNRFDGGRTLRQFTLANGQGIVTNAAYRIEHASDVYPSNEPIVAGGAAWVHWYIEPGAGALPADGALSAYILKAGGPTYGPIPMVRDPWRVLRRANGGAFYRARVPINLANEGYLDFTGRIVNTSGGALLFNAYRAGMTPESGRSYGVHNAWVPKRTITGPAYSESSWTQIFHTQSILTVDEGFWIFRFVPSWSLGEIPNLNGNAAASDGDRFTPSLWQSGPYGSGDRAFNCDVIKEDATHVRITMSVARGTPCPNPQDYRAWTISITGIPVATALATWPAMVDVDVAVAWKNCTPVALGFGFGAGQGLTWVTNGGTFLGGTVTFSTQAGLAWTFDGDTDDHMGVLADLDKIRQGGWFKAIGCGQSVESSAAIVEAQVDAFLLDPAEWGPRVDHR